MRFMRSVKTVFGLRKTLNETLFVGVIFKQYATNDHIIARQREKERGKNLSEIRLLRRMF